MDREQYKILKAQREEEKKAYEKTHHRDLCLGCFRKKSLCLCVKAKPFETKTQFIILMHPKEAKKQKIGTGRLSHLVLKNSQIWTGVDFSQDQRVNHLIQNPEYFCYLLYPDKDSFVPGQSNESTQIMGKKRIIFVLDGTWPCAKKMIKLSTNLRALPKISFRDNVISDYQFKHQPHESCLSTVESLHTLIKNLGKAGIEDEDLPVDNLLDLFKEMVDFQIQCSEDPEIPSHWGKKRSRETRAPKIREKKHRLFYWNEETSPIGDKGNLSTLKKHP